MSMDGLYSARSQEGGAVMSKFYCLFLHAENDNCKEYLITIKFYLRGHSVY